MANMMGIHYAKDLAQEKGFHVVHEWVRVTPEDATDLRQKWMMFFFKGGVCLGELPVEKWNGNSGPDCVNLAKFFRIVGGGS